MTISIRTRRDVVVVDPDQFLAAARQALPDRDPGLTDADRRHRFAAQIPELHWIRLVGKTSLPFSVGALVNEIVPRMGIANGLAAVGYSAVGSAQQGPDSP